MTAFNQSNPEVLRIVPEVGEAMQRRVETIKEAVYWLGVALNNSTASTAPRPPKAVLNHYVSTGANPLAPTPPTEINTVAEAIDKSASAANTVVELPSDSPVTRKSTAEPHPAADRIAAARQLVKEA